MQVPTMHRSMPNPLIHSIHQSVGVVTDKFLELIAEEIEFSTNEILKDMQNKNRRPARPTHCPLEMYWTFPEYRLRYKFREMRLFRSGGLFQSYTNFITAIAQKQKSPLFI